MTTAPWGLDADGQPKTAREAAHERIENVVKDYIDIGLKIAATGGFDDKTIHTIRHLFLSEPWLPASTAVQALESAGLLLHDVGCDCVRYGGAGSGAFGGRP